MDSWGISRNNNCYNWEIIRILLTIILSRISLMGSQKLKIKRVI